MNEKTNKHTMNYHYIALGLIFGAALGLIVGLLLFDELLLGTFVGAALGLIVGSIVDLQRPKEIPR